MTKLRDETIADESGQSRVREKDKSDKGQS